MKFGNFSLINKIRQNDKTNKNNNKLNVQNLNKTYNLPTHQNISQNITDSQTFSFSLENMNLNGRREKNLDEEISYKLKEETHLTPEELEKIKELKEIMEYKDYHVTLNENDICNSKNNSNVNDNLYLNDDYNLIHMNDDGDFSHEENYANLFHFEDYFSI